MIFTVIVRLSTIFHFFSLTCCFVFWTIFHNKILCFCFTNYVYFKHIADLSICMTMFISFCSCWNIFSLISLILVLSNSSKVKKKKKICEENNEKEKCGIENGKKSKNNIIHVGHVWGLYIFVWFQRLLHMTLSIVKNIICFYVCVYLFLFLIHWWIYIFSILCTVFIRSNQHDPIFILNMKFLPSIFHSDIQCMNVCVRVWKWWNQFYKQNNCTKVIFTIFLFVSLFLYSYFRIVITLQMYTIDTMTSVRSFTFIIWS